MSFSAQAWAKGVDLGPRSGPHQELLVYLADRMNKDTGRLFPSVGRMMRDLDRCRRSIQYSLRFLESVDLLVQHRRGRRVCDYTLRVGRTPNLLAARRRRGKCAPQQPANCAPQEARSVHLDGARSVHPEPKEDSNQERGTSESACACAPATPASPPQVFSTDQVEGKQAPGGPPPNSPHGGAVSPRPRAHPLPADWQLSAADIAYAVQRSLDPFAMAPCFQRHYSNRPQVRVADWSIQWQAWCDKEPGFARRQSAAERRDAAAISLQRDLAAGFAAMQRGAEMRP